jgi:hypothetical protein
MTTTPMTGVAVMVLILAAGWARTTSTGSR